MGIEFWILVKVLVTLENVEYYITNKITSDYNEFI